jgi:sugar O-acyltransferase (sialic acid O-acetyltransferase NeuD family)
VSSKPGIILGAGGHAKVVTDVLNLLGREILGFVTPDLDAGTEFCGKKVLGDDDYFKFYSPDEVELINGVGSLPRKNLRWKLVDKMRKQGYKFSSVIHPGAVVATDVSLDDGVQVMAGVVIQSGTKIGQDSIINTGVLIDHDCKIAENCHLAPGVVLSGGVVIGSNTHLGTGTVVTEYRSIGNNCIVAAGSVVFKDIVDSTILIQAK